MRFLASWMCGMACVVLAGCREGDRREEEMDVKVAERLARDVLVVDTHIDLPYRLKKKMEDISVRTEKGDFDYPRAAAGGLDVPFLSIYVPSSYQKTGGAKRYADDLIDMVEKIASDSPDKFALARSPADVRENHSKGRVSLAMGIENGAAVEDDLANVGYFYDRGIRYITLTHSENNQICDSSFDKERRWHGLSPFGRQVVAEMNRLGVMVDVSHVSDEAFHEVLKISRAPVIASHSSCRRFTPGWERNMDDDMIRLLASRGGVIQINFGSAFLLEATQKQLSAYMDAVRQYRTEKQLAPDDEDAVKPFVEQYWKDHPRTRADVSDVAAHIDHVVKLVGADHVGLGSDFEGVGDSLPTGLRDVSEYPNLIRALLEKGYPEQDIRKICGENLLRVWGHSAFSSNSSAGDRTVSPSPR